MNDSDIHRLLGLCDKIEDVIYNKVKTNSSHQDMLMRDIKDYVSEIKSVIKNMELNMHVQKAIDK